MPVAPDVEYLAFTELGSITTSGIFVKNT
jgi:hypothetical protein